MGVTMNNLEFCFNQAVVSGASYVGVLIEMEGFPQPEVIINKAENINSKLAYYKKTYDEDLNHRFAKGIKIIGCSYGDGFNDIQEDLT
ncbi:hypothetical protein P4H66_19405 [Paenibacillus dokdonensis]|uniref:Uncharacterized protein n=1 Tax=Paenibacillus dokdonensis TaxID=2567944 RepID=A0ABU6GRW7_9BACL|nr:hypothetical protein [Paenibacillus dokdonensis]MEC0241973.1 hypothetical protein [Paenibacillus dokdonensis]